MIQLDDLYTEVKGNMSVDHVKICLTKHFEQYFCPFTPFQYFCGPNIKISVKQKLKCKLDDKRNDSTDHFVEFYLI